jgi:hypothetical protein
MASVCYTACAITVAMIIGYTSSLCEVSAMPTHPGLCATCQHVKATTTKRGSVFYLCLRSQTDASFRKYPPLPVVQCRGYEPHREAPAPQPLPPRQSDM